MCKAIHKKFTKGEYKAKVIPANSYLEIKTRGGKGRISATLAYGTSSLSPYLLQDGPIHQQTKRTYSCTY